MLFKRRGSKMECNREKNLKSCTCTYSACDKQGLCCECIRYHWKMQELPGCLFPPDAEKTYDRSLRYFIEIWKDKC